VLDTRAYRVVSYEPTELVITARCGTPLAEIEALLAAHQQMLAFEPPRFGAASTIGGVVASALSGPRRASAGAVRDFVLGAVLMDGQGTILRFGGQVMKNVAGYDVSRLLAGSLGTLGLILEVSLKVLPLPLCETSLRFELSEIDALRRLNEWAGQPLPISASCWHQVCWQCACPVRRLPWRQRSSAWAARRWNTRHSGHRCAIRPTRTSAPAVCGGCRCFAASAVILGGEQLIEWGGAQRWLRTATVDAEQADAIRRTVAAAGGHATLYRSEHKPVGAFHPLSAPLRIHERLKASFDPAGIFNPGRMY
jgi:glycolate oxidase FAD binding subunit